MRPVKARRPQSRWAILGRGRGCGASTTADRGGARGAVRGAGRFGRADAPLQPHPIGSGAFGRAPWQRESVGLRRAACAAAASRHGPGAHGGAGRFACCVAGGAPRNSCRSNREVRRPDADDDRSCAHPGGGAWIAASKHRRPAVHDRSRRAIGMEHRSRPSNRCRRDRGVACREGDPAGAGSDRTRRNGRPSPCAQARRR
jgi:hypothetical protein